MKQQSITSLPLAPDVERHRRAVKYTIAMSVRVLCLISLLFVHGWWLLIPAAGAIFLPYFAVVIANVSSSSQGEVERPGNIVRVEPVGRADAGGRSDSDRQTSDTPASEAPASDTPGTERPAADERERRE